MKQTPIRSKDGKILATIYEKEPTDDIPTYIRNEALYQEQIENEAKQRVPQ